MNLIENMNELKLILSTLLRLDPVFNIGSRDSQSWMFKFCNAIKKVMIMVVTMVVNMNNVFNMMVMMIMVAGEIFLLIFH